MVVSFTLILGAYLFGSVPFAVILNKIKGIHLSQGEDRHQVLWRKGGISWGLSSILLEFSKGIIPILVGISLKCPLAIVASAGIASAVGQMWSIFCKFNGEKGNSTGVAMASTLTFAYGAYLVIFFGYLLMAIAAGIRAIPHFLAKDQSLGERLKFARPPSRSLPLGMAAAFAIMPLTSLCTQQPVEITLGLLCLFLIIMLRRLTAGLRADLRTGAEIKKILLNRLLYDRSNTGTLAPP